MPSGDQGIELTIDPQEWYRFKQKIDAIDPELARALRRRIRNAGNIAALAVKAALAEPTPGGTPLGSEAGRQALIQATRVSVSFGKAAAGARIMTTSARLPQVQKGLLKVYNKTSFRHPVFGDRNVWVTQEGHPYFGAAIYKVINRAILDEIRNAFADAAAAAGLSISAL
jgi:hypothetical protein